MSTTPAVTVTVTLHFAKGYIGEPYWPAREKVITIRKGSGVDRARSESKRTQALKAYLDAQDLTMEDYQALEANASRPFYTTPAGEIVIPSHHLHGMMAGAAAQAPAAIRPAKPEQIRTILEWGDLPTGKFKADGVWERFVRNPLTNQRRLQSSQYIEEVRATGTLAIHDAAQEKKIREFVAWAGREMGVGAARKMGWGRFVIVAWGA